MSIKTNKLLLALMILALVITPMRGAWALPTTASDDSTPHCAQMELPAGEQHMDTAADTGRQCPAGCNGECCDGDCNACAHSVVSLSNTVVVSQNTHDTSLAVLFSATFPHRTIIPPLRPPASL